MASPLLHCTGGVFASGPATKLTAQSKAGQNQGLFLQAHPATLREELHVECNGGLAPTILSREPASASKVVLAIKDLDVLPSAESVYSRLNSGVCCNAGIATTSLSLLKNMLSPLSVGN